MPEIDFSKIAQKIVGYELKPAGINHPRSLLEKITFEDFILSYNRGASSPQKVYERLKRELDNSGGHLEYLADTESVVKMDNIASTMLRKEAFKNAMKLIKEHYPEIKD